MASPGAEAQPRVRTISNADSEFVSVKEERKTSRGTARHCIQTIEALNVKIANLTSELQSFASSAEVKLIADTSSDVNTQTPNQSTKDPQPSASLMECEAPINDIERNQSDNLTRVLTALTMLKEGRGGKTALPSAGHKGFRKDGLSSNKKPMLVELHTFPGFEEKALTPLPSSLSAKRIALLVIESQNDLPKKPTFKRELEKFFCESKEALALLQDVFWWYFCNKYQPTAIGQSNLFRRISFNYTYYVIRWIGSRYQRKLFARLPDLICQGVYAAFCHAFPESFKQFDDQFKHALLNVVYLWINGTRPAAQAWKGWNFEVLEPTKVRVREQLEGASVKARPPAFDPFPSEEDLHPFKSTGEYGSRLSPSETNPGSRQNPNRLTDTPVEKDEANMPNIKGIDEGWGSPDSKQARFLKSTSPSAEKFQKRSPLGKPIYETNRSITKKARMSRINESGKSSGGRSLAVSGFRSQSSPESCAMGKGPNFCKVLFDIFGRSPLVEHFVQSYGLAKDTGYILYMQRTEIEKLPPSSFPTYKDLVRKRFKASKALSANFKRSMEDNSIEHAKQVLKWKEILSDYKRRCMGVLQNLNEVQKLSVLLEHQGEMEDGERRNAVLAVAVANALGYTNALL